MVELFKQISLLTVFAVLLLFSNTVMAENTPLLELDVPIKTLLYGKSLDISLTTQQNWNTDIQSFLKPLRQDFDYSILSTSKEQRKKIWKIRLFPLHPGRLEIPALQYNQHTTQVVKIKVAKPFAKDNEPISIQLSPYRNSPWVREQNQLLVKIISTDKNILLNSKNILTKGSESYLIPQSSRKLINGKTVHYEYTFGWNIFFLYQQNTRVNLPAIEYIKDGVPQYKFHLPPVNLNVKALPVYIRPTIPVGQIKLKAHYLMLPGWLMQPDKTAIIQYTLSGENIPAKWLPSLLQKYNKSVNTGVDFIPVKTVVLTNTEQNNISGKKITDIAFTPHSNGMLSIKDIQLQYFDPQSGLLKSVQLQHPPLLVLHWLLQILLVVLTIMLLYPSLRRVIQYLQRKFQQYQYYRYCNNKITTAETYADIKSALQDFSQAEQWPINQTLSQWLNCWNTKYKYNAGLEKLVRELNQLLYANNLQQKKSNIPALRDEMVRQLASRKRKPGRLRNYILHRLKTNSVYLSQQG